MNKCKKGKCTVETLLDAVNCPFNCHFTVADWCAMERNGECTNPAALEDADRNGAKKMSDKDERIAELEKIGEEILNEMGE